MSNQASIFDAVKNSRRLSFKGFVDAYSSQQDITSADYRRLYSNGFVFKQYKDLKDAFDYIEELRAKKLSGNTNIYEDTALLYVSDEQYNDYKSFVDYISQNEPSNAVTKKVSKNILENINTFINLGGLYEKDKIVITQDERGVFDFGLASLGLYRPVEFYSEKLKSDIENKDIKNPYPNTKITIGVVKNEDVTKIGDSFYFKIDNKEYLCQKRQKGTTDVYNKYFEICDLKQNSDGIFLTYEKGKNKVFNGTGKVRLKYASSNKKSYLMFQKSDDNVKYVDIFIPINFLAGVNDSTRILVLLPAFLIASTLEKYGVNCRISGMRIGSDNQTHISVSVTVKDYLEPAMESFDKVFKLLATEEMAQRFMAFLKITASNEGIQSDPTKDKSTSFSDLRYNEQPYILDMMQRYKNWAKINKDKPFINTKVTNPNFQFAITQEKWSGTRGSLTLSDIVSRLHYVFYNYYFYIDFLAIEMLPMQKFIKSLYERFSNDESFLSLFEVPTDTKGKKELIRDYVVRMLVQKYVIVQGGAYSDTQEQINEKNKMFASKLKLLDESLNSIG
jgi:hypothetical protein